MAIPLSYKKLSSRAKKHLQIITHRLNSRSKAQAWRRQNKDNNLKTIAPHNLVLFGDLFLMSQGNPKTMRALLNLCNSEVQATLNQLNDPESIKNMLQLNSSLSPLFLDYVNNQAAIVEAENLLDAQNQQDCNNMMEEIIESDILNNDAVKQAANDSSIDPYKELGVSPDASQSLVQIKCLETLSEKAAEGTSSHTFITAAAATTLIGTHELRKNYDSNKNIFAESSELHTGMSTPKPRPPIWE